MDAQWRASKLKYFLYRRALQQVFDYVGDYNRVREWWNSDGGNYATPREHLFEKVGQASRLPSRSSMLESKAMATAAGAGETPALLCAGNGAITWLREPRLPGQSGAR